MRIIIHEYIGINYVKSIDKLNIMQYNTFNIQEKSQKEKNKMKILKKLIAATAVAAMALCLLAGCSEKPADADNKDNQGTKAKLTMATNAAFPPYEYRDGNDIVGIDAEVAKLIADKLGMELEIADIEFDSIVPGVQQHKYDMGMAGMTVNEDRLKEVNFTDSYAKGVQVVIVKDGGTVASLDDIEGKMIGAQQGTTGAIYAADDYGEEHVTTYSTGNLAVEALKSGKIDCVIIDNEPAKAYVKENEGLKILDTEYANEDYAIAIAKDNAELMEKVNGALKELIANGELQKIINKYIPAEG